MAGLKQMHAGLTSVFVGAEQMLGDQRILTAADRSVVLEAMASTLPRIKEAFSPKYRIELKKTRGGQGAVRQAGGRRAARRDAPRDLSLIPGSEDRR